MFKKTLILTLALAPSLALANDFPTQARVEYVLLCMKDQGGQSIKNLYACSCAADNFAGRISYDKYVEAQTLRDMISTPGEKGGAFRDVPGGRKMLRGVDDMKAAAINACSIKAPSVRKASANKDEG